MCDLAVVATTNTKYESQGSLAEEAKLPLPLLFYFSCEHQLLGNQRLLVILPVSIAEGPGFCESLVKTTATLPAAWGALIVLVAFGCLMPAPTFGPGGCV